MTRTSTFCGALLTSALQVSCASTAPEPTSRPNAPCRTLFDLPELPPVVASVVETEWPLDFPKTAVPEHVLVVFSLQPRSNKLDLVFREADDSRTHLTWSFMDSRGQRRLVAMRRGAHVADVSVEYVEDYGRFVGFVDAAASRIYCDDELLMFDLLVSPEVATAM
ncbi:MAG: hypothetical protein JNN27_09275, partial [Planctomycetes bacterium]|nr:hypothetical protein [Planctomycetota bacterium]